jgi:hypothetical protein
VIRRSPRRASPSLLLVAPLLLLLAGGAEHVALAAEPTPSDKALAEALFRDGKRLMDEGKQVREACAKLAESQRIDPKLGTLLNLAACHEKEGRTASAWAEFTEAASLAAKQDQEDRVEFAKGRALDLERRLSRLLIQVSAPEPDMRITLNNRTMSAAAVGSSIPVDPGELSIKVTAPGKEPWSEKVVIAPGPSTKRLLIPELKEKTSPEPDPPPPEDAPEDPPRAAESRGFPPLFIGGMAAAGVGLVGIGVGAVFGARTLSKAGEVEENCDGLACNAAGLEANDEAYTSATISTVAFSAGLACAAAGAAMMIIAGPSKGAKKSGGGVWVAPSAFGSGGQLTLGGRW